MKKKIAKTRNPLKLSEENYIIISKSKRIT